MSYRSNVYILKEDDWYVANSVETGIASQGRTIEESLANLKEALELYFENNKETMNKYEASFVTSLEVIV